MSSVEEIENGGIWICSELQTALQMKSGLAIGKLGTSELAVLERALMKIPYDYLTVQHATLNAGLWPKESLKEWAYHMFTEVLPNMDGMVEWNSSPSEKVLLDTFAPKSQRLVLRSLEPYYQVAEENQWTRYLSGSIAVVSPFAESISKQVTTGLDIIWKKKPIWSSQPKVHTIRTGCSPAIDSESPAAWPSDILLKGWKAAVEDCVNRVLATDAQVVLVGCGALSLPIVAALKKAGKVAIHLGGATQILFGIRGKRWDSHSVIREFYTEEWISPSSEETPRHCKKVEGGCYWQS